MTYIWTKKRKKAGKRLSTFMVFIIMYALISDQLPNLNPVNTINTHPVFTIITTILILVGLYGLAEDITTLMIYEGE